ncbi:protein LYK5-like [Hordeum vulgare]|nr:protein LYK5-like [Hordeum vulgare]
MEPRRFLCCCLVAVLAVASRRCDAQGGAGNGTGRFACVVPAPCDTFVLYRTQSPGSLDLGAISDLFGVSRAMIAAANNLSLTDEDAALLPDQPLLVPVRCGCTGNRSFVNVTYPIHSGDTFYALALTGYENLTTPDVIQELNPQAVFNKLNVSQLVTVPLFCRCPTPAERSAGVLQHITYMWRPVDTMSRVSKLMGSDASAIAAANNVSADFTSTTMLPMLIPVARPPVLPPLRYGPSATTGDPGATKRFSGATVAASIAGSLVAVAALCVAIFGYRRYRRKKATVHSASRFASPRFCFNQNAYGIQSSSSIARMINGGDKLLTSVSQFIDKPVIFGTAEIMEATMNLDERCRIGSSYYRAKLEGEVFAVKPAKGDVSAELRMMQMVNHANLIRLAGISIGADGDYTFLVYEFAEKGSLDKWLYQKPPSSLPSSSSSVDTLSWNQRLGIALDVANGLLYMHEHTQPSMVHGDVRARNILLTADFRARISNFSVATPAMADAAATSSDVFAFGLLVLELLSGRTAMEARVGAEIGMLWRDIRAVLEAGDKRDAKLRKWMDPALGDEYYLDAALSLAGMARACTEEDAARRPKMADVVFSLSMLVQPLPVGDAFEKLWQPSSEENIRIVNEVAAR